MSAESQPEIPKTDEESFGEIKALLAEGWRFGGNIFEGKQSQAFQLVMSKEGEENKIFHTTKPYPEVFDSDGTARNIF